MARKLPRKLPQIYYPVPEAITDLPIKIDPVDHKFGACCSIQDSVMHVPLDGSAQSEVIRAHEQGHLKWSPKLGPDDPRGRGIKAEYILAAEDLRIHYLLKNSGIDLSAGLVDIYTAETMGRYYGLEHTLLGVGKQVGLMLAATVHTGSTVPFIKGVKRSFRATKHPKFSRQARIRYLGNIIKDLSVVYDINSDQDQMFHVAKWLQSMFEEPEYVEEVGIDVSLRIDGPPSGAEAEDIPYIRAVDPYANWEEANWGSMSIDVDKPFVEYNKGYMGAKYASEEYGVSLRSPHRWTTDKRLFTRIKKVRGGTVLIDHSGSMGLEPKQIRAIVNVAPGATIATYSGYRESGVLRIIARNGRMVKPSDMGRPALNYNVIDGPALEWLREQAKPRFWVSDGCVTGKRDCPSKAADDAARDLCARGSISHLKDVSTAVKVFKDLAKR